jgi:alkylation response protein AidB-like acyl-CoA dehydrogenase
MKLLEEEFAHPTQVSRVRLRIFQLPEGFLVTEERQGVTTVFSTLGLFDRREAAEACVRARAAQLEAQRYLKLQPAA